MALRCLILVAGLVLLTAPCSKAADTPAEALKRIVDVAYVIAAQADLGNGTFLAWALQNNRTYNSSSELLKRLLIFRAAVNASRAVNDLNGNFWARPGPYADLGSDELQGTANGFLPATINPVAVSVNISNPTTALNWTALGFVTPVKNQGQCGACWAFATVATTESINAIRSNSPQNTGSPNNLSEQQLVDCSTAQGNDGCNGGNLVDAYNYILANTGINSAPNYPYVSPAPSTCNIALARAIDKNLTNQYSVIANNATQLQAAVSLWPVAVGIAASSSTFQNYAGGVIDDFSGCGYDIDHAVTVVGYNTAASPPYWIVKNSWGTGWGEQGYVNLAMTIPAAGGGITPNQAKSGMCGILSQPAAPILSGTVAALKTPPPPAPPPSPAVPKGALRLGAQMPALLVLLGAGVSLLLGAF